MHGLAWPCLEREKGLHPQSPSSPLPSLLYMAVTNPGEVCYFAVEGDVVTGGKRKEVRNFTFERFDPRRSVDKRLTSPAAALPTVGTVIPPEDLNTRLILFLNTVTNSDCGVVAWRPVAKREVGSSRRGGGTQRLGPLGKQ